MTSAAVQESLPSTATECLHAPPVAADPRASNHSVTEAPFVKAPPRCSEFSPSQDSSRSKIPDSTVDSALLSALRDSRERLGLLKLEQVFVEFLASSDDCWEVGGPYNGTVRKNGGHSNGPVSNNNSSDYRTQTTFQRCILHRLADRFAITREPQEDGFIRIIKSSQSSMPSKLLLNLDTSYYNSANAGGNSSLEEPMEQLALQTNNSATTGKPNSSKPRKMKIMKRSGSNTSSNSNNSSRSKNKTRNQSVSSLSDKERAYAEARARIFQESQEQAMSATTGSSADDSVHPPSTISSNPWASPRSSSAPPSANLDTSPQEARDQSNKPSKATWKNRQSEMNDPDFQRGRGSMVVGAPQHTPYYPSPVAAAPAATIGYGYGQPPPAPYSYGYPNQRRGTGRGGGIPYQSGLIPHYPTSQQNASQQHAQPHYRRSHSASETPSVHSMEDFPSLR